MSLAAPPFADAELPALARDPGFRLRRVQNWLLLGLLYAFFYMARYNYTAASPYLASVFGWTKTELGIFETVMPLVYGLAVVINGPLSDKIGGRRAFLIGASGVAVFNLLFGLGALAVVHPATWTGVKAARHVVDPAAFRFGMTSGTMLAMLATVWAANGYFQSFGAGAIVKVNAQWFHVRERGTFAAVFGVLIRLGLILAFQGSPLILGVLPWQWVFWIPAVAVAAIALANLFFVRDTPAEAGRGHFDTGDGDGDEGGSAGRATLGFVLRKVFAGRVTWMIAVASMMVGFVRRSVIDAWYPVYFAEVHGANREHLASFGPYELAVWGIALAGIAGGFAFGITSDRVYGGRRAPVVTVGFIGMAATLLAFAAADRAHAGPWAAAGLLMLLSFFVNGAHGMIGGAASMDFGGRKAAATAAGLFDGMQYLAGAGVGVGLGALLQHVGWRVWQLAPVPFALVGAVVMSRLWNARPARDAAQATPDTAADSRR